MKNTLNFLFGASFMLLFSFIEKPVFEVKPNTAEAIQINGLYIFKDSKPVKEYEVLGTVKIKVFMNSSVYSDARDYLITEAKEKYPTGQALIFETNRETNKAEVIKFK